MTRIVGYIFAVLTAQALLVFASEALAVDRLESVEITMKTRASLTSPRIYLSDIAKCGGADVRCQEISGIEVGPSPLPGRTGYVHSEQVEAILEKEWHGVEVSFAGAESTRVESVAVEVSAEEIRAKLENYLIQKLHGQESVRLRVVRLQPVGQVNIRPTQSRVEFVDVASLAVDDINWVLRNLVGNRGIQIRFSNPDDADDKLMFQGNAVLSVEMQIPLLKQTVAAGKIIEEKDLEVGWFQMRRGYQDLAFNSKSVIGRKTRQSMHGGDPISMRFLENPVAIKRNQTVKMIVRSAGMEISARAIAQDQGVIGQSIDVLNASTRKKVRARVIDDQTVEAVAF